MTPIGIDHIIYASHTLESGMDEIEALLGIRPVPAGQHPKYGTHNALLSLGPGVYFEVIARDPTQPLPDDGALVDVAKDEPSRLLTWVYRTDDIERVASALRAEGFAIGEVSDGSRRTADGSDVHWRFTNPYAMPMEGALPFLIDWGDTTHPSLVLPEAGRLAEVVIVHPEPERIMRALSMLGTNAAVLEGEKFEMSVTVETDKGLVGIPLAASS